MKKTAPDDIQSQIRKLAFEALQDFPDGKIPKSAHIETIFPEIFQAKRFKSSEKKKTQEALALIHKSLAHTAALELMALSAYPEIQMMKLGDFSKNLLLMALYECLECQASWESLFREYNKFYNHYLQQRHLEAKSENGEKVQADDESLNFEKALFASIFYYPHFCLCVLLAEMVEANVFSEHEYKRKLQKLGYTEDFLPPKLLAELLQGLISSREMLDASLEKFLSPKHWQRLPSLFRNILRIALYEILINLAPINILSNAFSGIIRLFILQYPELSTDAAAQTEKFLKMQLEKSARSLGRALAFQIIYGLAFTDISSIAMLKAAYAHSPYNISGSADLTAKSDDLFSWRLVRGVWEQAAILDGIIDRYSHKWRVERMGKIEITLLRLALYEMLHEKTHPRIVISEIMDIADMFGAMEAKNLVNGILDAVSKSKEFQFLQKQS